MIRSMSAAVTGLRGHQQKLDVVGNNIANVNTVGFKKSQARFEDLISQTIQGATGPMEDRGGINPSQVGLGMRVSSITDIHTQGAITSTDRVTDLAIEGEGYFVVTDGQMEYYTRDGSFGLDRQGNLVNDNGLRVIGIDGTPINIPVDDNMVAQATENMRFAGNLDAGSYYEATSGSVNGAIALDDAAIAALNQAITIEFTIDGGAVQEMELTADEMDDINDQDELLVAINDGEDPDGDDLSEWDGLAGATASFDDDGFLVITSGSLGADSTVTVGGDDVAVLFGDAPETVDGSDEVAEAYSFPYYVHDSLGRRYDVDYTFTPVGHNQWQYELTVSDADGNIIDVLDGDTGTLVFDENGGFDEDNSVIPSLVFDPPGDAAQVDVAPDFSAATQLAGTNNLLVREQDGYEAGALAAFDIDRAGVVTGTYTNGMNQEFGQLSIATFSNPEGLQKEGGNLFSETINSGDAQVGAPGTEGRGLLQSSALELSNTDLAYEFTELITTSRAFQANTRVVTTSDEVLTEVVNMKR